jgi:hypothetical protein
MAGCEAARCRRHGFDGEFVTIESGLRLDASLAEVIRSAFATGATLDLSRAKPPNWADAIDVLMVRGDFDPACYAARQLAAANPNLTYPRKIIDLIDRLPPADATLLPFSDNPSEEIQIVKRDEANTVLFLFGDLFYRFGAHTAAIHRWVGLLPVSLVYLRDFRRIFFLDGIPSLGLGRDATIAGLRDISAALGCDRILCFGYSMGAFAALHYALDLEADAAVAFGGVYKLPPIVNSRAPAEYFRHPVCKKVFDLRKLFEAASRSPKALIVYGEQNPRDRDSATYLGGLPSVRLHSVGDYPFHHLVAELIRRGEFANLLVTALGLQSRPDSECSGARRL